ncbi:aspartate/methionine/tyrosine aminotransferase [Trinickia symbiotica]|uniref:Aminotransferase n=1 Tax=Trinickia symbiotica TaxID=863227 RepID=A0A2N7X5R9_9BURK|nr:pyridoxal phosphate-dependent aminotransferase [Trinickia symbiotica]PMS36815.1 aspartate aminotransferase [Trinickia symbiotica]PPK46268.1 aspartate/methionine/tyrosine aminotransferase [Trinickia symbiotica]
MKNFEIRNLYFDKLCNTPGLMWLGQNTNHYEPHESVREAVIKAMESGEYHAYAPPAGFEELRKLIREDMGIPDASVLVTDGAVEALYNVCANICESGTDFVTTDPSWAWPMAFARRAGSNVVELPIYNAEQGYKLTVEQLRKAVSEKTRVIYLVDPNNPLGTCHTEDEIRAIADIARSVGAYLIHDATYCHFAEKFTPAYKFYPEKTIVTYSFSKWLGLAGMRLGAVLASPDIIEKLATASPNNLGSNVLSQRAAIAGLKTKSQWFPDIWRRQRRNQSVVAETAKAIEGLAIPVFPSNANLLVIETIDAGVNPEALVAAYQEKGVMIRQGTYHTKRFGERFVKVSLTVPELWADRFCDLLPAMVERARKIEVPPSLF